MDWLVTCSRSYQNCRRSSVRKNKYCVIQVSDDELGLAVYQHNKRAMAYLEEAAAVNCNWSSNPVSGCNSRLVGGLVSEGCPFF